LSTRCPPRVAETIARGGAERQDNPIKAEFPTPLAIRLTSPQ
jgi:hypothetical protein